MDKSPSFICQYYYGRAGITIFMRVTNLRIEKALHLLSTTEKNIDDIAKEVGYYDSAAFHGGLRKWWVVLSVIGKPNVRTVAHVRQEGRRHSHAVFILALVASKRIDLCRATPF